MPPLPETNLYFLWKKNTVDGIHNHGGMYTQVEQTGAASAADPGRNRVAA